jgi:hypothetical protein
MTGRDVTGRSLLRRPVMLPLMTSDKRLVTLPHGEFSGRRLFGWGREAILVTPRWRERGACAGSVLLRQRWLRGSRRHPRARKRQGPQRSLRHRRDRRRRGAVRPKPTDMPKITTIGRADFPSASGARQRRKQIRAQAAPSHALVRGVRISGG